MRNVSAVLMRAAFGALACPSTNPGSRGPYISAPAVWDTENSGSEMSWLVKQSAYPRNQRADLCPGTCGECHANPTENGRCFRSIFGLGVEILVCGAAPVVKWRKTAAWDVVGRGVTLEGIGTGKCLLDTLHGRRARCRRIGTPDWKGQPCMRKSTTMRTARRATGLLEGFVLVGEDLPRHPSRYIVVF